MSLARRPRGAAFAVVAVLTALGVVLFVWDGGGGGEPTPTREDARAIQARADLAPRKVLFGDTVTAFVEVTLDRNRVDPGSVRVRADFSPWRHVAIPKLVRRDGETTTALRMTYLLRCVTSACISTDEAAVLNETSVQTFGQARVTYAAREGAWSGGRTSLQAPWPRLNVDARYSQRDAQSAGASATGWRADLLSMPAVTYGMTPGLLFALLLAAGTLLTIAAGVFAYAARIRRAPPVSPQADGPPGPVLTPLELALELLETSARVDGATDQRRALELVAAALAERGDTKLAHASRVLAWSKPLPGVRETNGLAARARSALGQELHEISA